MSFMDASPRGIITLREGRLYINGRRLSPNLRKEVRTMPVTITFHVFGFTFTLRIVKKENRHPGR